MAPGSTLACYRIQVVYILFFVFVFSFVDSWSMPLTKMHCRLDRAYDLGMKAGDIEMSLLSILSHNLFSFYAGMPLGPVIEDNAIVLATIRQYNVGSALGICELLQEYTLMLLTPRWLPVECNTCACDWHPSIVFPLGAASMHVWLVAKPASGWLHVFGILQRLSNLQRKDLTLISEKEAPL